MRTLLAMATIAVAAVAPTRADVTGGTVRSGQVTIEVLGSNGEREIRTAEGFIRVEPGQPDRGGTGSFAIVQAGAPAAAPAVPPAPGLAPSRVVPDVRAGSGLAVARRRFALERSGLVDTAAPQPGPDPCREQRSRYARQLLRSAGVDVEDPVALLQGLAGPSAYGGDLLSSGYLLSGIDPIRPLAWDMELRSIARDLASCEQRSTSIPPG